jgi:hypothetical protein
MKPDVGMGFAVLLQHLRGYIPDPFHEYIQRAGFQGKRYFIVYGDPDPRFLVPGQ